MGEILKLVRREGFNIYVGKTKVAEIISQRVIPLEVEVLVEGNDKNISDALNGATWTRWFPDD